MKRMERTVEYPEYLICPYCENRIHLDYSEKYAVSDDIHTFLIKSPFSAKTGNDARENKQEIGDTFVRTTFCRQCKRILGTDTWTGR
ncbi:MAG: hypothetical protein ACXAEU_12190 [Candidatus Hodarchaeales archaeon]